MTRTDNLIDVWLLRADHNPSRLQLQSEEVSAAQCVGTDMLREMIRDGQFHDYGPDYLPDLCDCSLGVSGGRDRVNGPDVLD